MRKIVLLGVLAFVYVQSMAQQKNVSGVITDSKTNAPLSGVTIRVKSSKQAVVSAADGNFNLSVPQAATTLIISYVGYDQKEVSITGANVSIQLNPSLNYLSEVVVTGVGIATSRKKLGISVESVTADKLPQTPSASIDQALVGKIPGAQISSVNGTPGAPASITLRGINTLNSNIGTKPLILLDGVEVYSTNINSLDLSTIERVEVVQGAASATIYGAQGANGVIQLFTKKGRKGQLAINFSSSYSLDQYINNGDLHKATMHSFLTDDYGNVIDFNGNIVDKDRYGLYQGVTWEHLAIDDTGHNWISAMLNPNNINDKPYNKNLQYYDHFKQLFGNGYSINNNLNISNASDVVDYSFGISNNHDKSAIRNNGFVDRSNITSNVGIKLLKGLTLRSITELVYTKNTLHPFYGFGGSNIFNVMNVSPFYDLNQTLRDGMYPYNYYPDNGLISVNGYNPNFDFQNTSSNDIQVDIVQNLQLNYVVNKFVELDAKYGINNTRDDIKYIFKNQSENPNVNYEATWAYYNNADDATGEIDNFSYNTTSQNLLLTAYIKTDFQNDFHINVPITTSTQFTYDYRHRNYSQYFTYGHGLPIPVYNMERTLDQHVTSDYVEPFITFGYLINQKIDFGNYGGISGGFRSDYSSAFGGGSKPFTFPRADAYIRPSSLNFWKNGGLGNTINEFKLRAAYGEAGIQPNAFDRYITLKTSNIGSALSFNLGTCQNNPLLQVELSKEFEAGTDISINAFKGSWVSNINISGTYWKRKGENVIFDISAIPSTGVNTFKDNAITLSSHGVQASLNIAAYRSKNFNWDLTVNFSNERSKIDAIRGGDIILTTSAGSTSIVLTPGQQIGQLYGYKALTSVSETHLDGTPYIDKTDYGNYEIVNGILVNKISKAIQFTNEKFPLGTGTPKFNMSFINSFTYKDIVSLGFQFDWVDGNFLYNQTKEWMYRDGIHSDYDVPVTIDGQSAAYVAYYRSAYASYFGDPNGAARNGTKDYFLEDASFLRLRNISLGVDISKIVSVKYFKKLQLVFTGRNILTFTKYSGFDPEVNSASFVYSPYDRGIDHNSMPNVKSYQVGLNVGF